MPPADRAGVAVAGVAGPTAASAADGGQVVLTFPAGARAQPLPPGQAPDLLARMPCWMQLAGITDALLVGRGDPGQASRDARPSLEDGLMSAWSGPFAWLMLAEPVSAGQLYDLAAEVSLAQFSEQRSDSPPAQLAAQRLSARHAELRQAAATGLWKVRVAAGGAAPAAAAQIAGLLCASTDLDGLPYALAPVPGYAGLAETLEGPLPVAASVHAGLPRGAAAPGPRRSGYLGPGRAVLRLIQAGGRAGPAADPGTAGHPVRAAARLRCHTGDHGPLG